MNIILSLFLTCLERIVSIFFIYSVLLSPISTVLNEVYCQFNINCERPICSYGPFVIQSKGKQQLSKIILKTIKFKSLAYKFVAFYEILVFLEEIVLTSCSKLAKSDARILLLVHMGRISDIILLLKLNFLMNISLFIKNFH